METTEWIIIVASMLILPVILIPASLLMIKRGRGYNTFGRGGASMEAQSFAARHCGRIMLRISVIIIVIVLACGGLSFAFLYNEVAINIMIWIMIAVPLVLVLLPVIFTEMATRRYFDRNGKPY